MNKEEITEDSIFLKKMLMFNSKHINQNHLLRFETKT